MLHPCCAHALKQCSVYALKQCSIRAALMRASNASSTLCSCAKAMLHVCAHALKQCSIHAVLMRKSKAPSVRSCTPAMLNPQEPCAARLSLQHSCTLRQVPRHAALKGAKSLEHMCSQSARVSFVCVGVARARLLLHELSLRTQKPDGLSMIRKAACVCHTSPPCAF